MPAQAIKIQFEADPLTANGPTVDGSTTLGFSVGEHQQLEVAKLLTVAQQTDLSVTVEVSRCRA